MIRGLLYNREEVGAFVRCTIVTICSSVNRLLRIAFLRKDGSARSQFGLDRFSGRPSIAVRDTPLTGVLDLRPAKQS